MTYFFHDFLWQGSSGGVRSDHYLMDLQDLYSKAKSDSALHAITESLALMSFANKKDIASLKTEALKKYGSSLVKLRVNLNDPEFAMSDETLMTILAMLFYEVS